MHHTVDDINPAVPHNKEYTIIPIARVLKVVQDVYHPQ